MQIRKSVTIWAGIALATWSSGAGAQSTDCQWQGSIWSCDRYNVPDPNQGYRDLGTAIGILLRNQREKKAREEVAALRAQQQAAIEAERAAAAAQVAQEQTLMAMVSQAIQEGQCEDAKAIALTQNRLDVAAMSQRLCVPKRASRPSAMPSKARRRAK